jgi:hypothetical protein
VGEYEDVIVMLIAMTEGGWVELPDELLAKVLELLQAGGSFSQASACATVRLVCAGWKAVHDAMVTRRCMLNGRPPTRPWACWCGGSRQWCRWRYIKSTNTCTEGGVDRHQRVYRWSLVEPAALERTHCD